ncbi:MAG: hypothetical protein ACI8O8_003158, partial [Oleiphilaceae bacterium]
EGIQITINVSVVDFCVQNIYTVLLGARILIGFI